MKLLSSNRTLVSTSHRFLRSADVGSGVSPAKLRYTASNTGNRMLSSSENPYSVLGEPIKLGPVVAPNRFFQVPHCNGMGFEYPNSVIKMREVKAEGGWGVVSTEEVEIHPASEFAPCHEGRLWDSTDMKMMRKLTDAIHKHGSLAACELAFNGPSQGNRYSRETVMAPINMPIIPWEPIQAKAMDLQDIKNVRQWHREAVLRAIDSGFDIVYVYAGHNLSLLMHFLQPHLNQRTDEYGGSLENRVRLLREVLIDTKEECQSSAAVALRFAVQHRGLPEQDQLRYQEEAKEVVAMLAELPDVWDVNVADWSSDSKTSRFAPLEGYQEDAISFVKKLTTKPVVGVGRYTTPDAMVAAIRNGVVDMIGAARPSIADPFLPNKILNNQPERIRECIGCNICVSGDNTMVPMRCTQNPSIGEEWRRGWHPEHVSHNITADSKSALIIGGGPAGLECAHTMWKRGYSIILVDEAELGGRSRTESKLPGLSAWKRVADYRIGILSGYEAVQLFTETVTEEVVAEFTGPEAKRPCAHVICATGSTWDRSGRGRSLPYGLKPTDQLPFLSPSDVLQVGVKPTDIQSIHPFLQDISNPICVFDDDHYYMGSVMAELFAKLGYPVHYVTPSPDVAHWTHMTLEQRSIQRRLLELGVQLHCNSDIAAVQPEDQSVVLSSTYTGLKEKTIPVKMMMMVTSRIPNTTLYDRLLDRNEWFVHKSTQLHLIGDALVPGTMAAAVHSGHKTAMLVDTDISPYDFKRERLLLQ